MTAETELNIRSFLMIPTKHGEALIMTTHISGIIRTRERVKLLLVSGEELELDMEFDDAVALLKHQFLVRQT